MSHQQLRIQGGVIVNETPVVNTTGIASSNRIRFKPDPQGLSIPEKLGGWAKFYASQITNGVVRALWGWQDTNDNQWIGFGTDNSTGAQLEAIQCTVNGSSGLTTATGTPQSLMPLVESSNQPAFVIATAGSNLFQITDGIAQPGHAPYNWSVYITTPISVGGVVLQGLYPMVYGFGVSATFEIAATDVLGNPLPALYSTINDINITGVTFTGGTPNTLTVTYSVVGSPPTPAPGEAVNISVVDNSISGTYIVLSSSSGSFVVATTLGSYTFATSGTWDNTGTTPIYATTNGSVVVTTTFPDHGQVVGNPWYILNPTLVGGLTLQGTYTITSVPNSYTFTFNAMSAATATNFQYQGSIQITGGHASGSAVTVDYSTSLFNSAYTRTSGPPLAIYVQGVNPAGWNGWNQLTGASAGAATYTNGSASGSWVSGGSFSMVGGMMANIYVANEVAGGSVPAGFWSLDSWGNDLIAVSGNTPFIKYPTYNLPFQPIFYWDATTAPPAVIMGNGPPASNGAFVAMPQRQIVAWGSTFSGIIDPLLIRWCDVNNFNTWVAQTTNQAGSFRLASGSAIIGGRQTPQMGLIWTDIELWTMLYINQPYVYSFNKIGSGCGLIGKYAHGILGGIVYWMSKTQFWMLSYEGAIPIPCPVWDVIFQDLDLVNADKITCATNAMFQEVTWYFPVIGGTGENSQYVKYNAQLGVWDYGTLDRSASLDVSVLQQPIGFSPANKYIYQHEISPDADGAAMGETFTTGWFALAEGDVMPYADQWWPDFKWGYYGQSQNANVTMSFAAQAYPGTSLYSYGPYTISESTSYISPRVRSRLVNFTVSGTGTGTFWRLGGIRYRVQADGKF